MAFTKITASDLANKGVIGLPDVPGLSTSDMQNKLEETARSVIIPKHNALIDEMENGSAAASLGAIAPTGLTGNNVQALIDDLNLKKENTPASLPSADTADTNDTFNIRKITTTYKITFANLVASIKTAIGNATTAVSGLFSAEDKTKLNGIEDNANNYSLPKASDSELGGVKIGEHLVIDSDGVLSLDGSEVFSVNGKSGTVVLDATDIDLATPISGQSTVEGAIGANANAITVLNGADTVTGSVAKKVKDAINALDKSDSAVAGSYVTAVSEANGKITVTREAADSTPTASSNKMIKSGAVYDAFAALGTAAAKNSTSSVTKDSTDLIESGAVYNGLASQKQLLSDTVNGTVGWISRNLFDIKTMLYQTTNHGVQSSLIDDIGHLEGTVETSTGYYIGSSSKKMLLKKGTYTFSIAFTGSFGTTTEFRLRKVEDSSRITRVYTNDLTPTTFTLNADTEVFLGIVNDNAPVDTVVNADFKVQIENGDHATDITSYHASVEEYCASKELLENTVGWTGKNFNKYPYYDSDTKTSAGIEYSVNADKSVNGNGTSTGSSQYVCHSRTSEINDLVLPNGKYILNGCPNIQGCYIYIRCTKNSQSVNLAIDTGNGAEFTVNGDDNWQDKARVNVLIQVTNGTVLNNVTFKPMIRSANTTDDTYVPYHASVEEAKTDNTVIAPVENGTTVQKSDGYAVGSHAMRNGKFITWINAKAQGETINDASDYSVGDVGSLLTVVSGNATSYRETLTIASGYEKVYKQGNVVNFNIRFTLTEASTTGSYALISLPWIPLVGTPHFSIVNRTAPYEHVCNCFVSSLGNISINGVELAAGTYEVGGTYIC